MSSGTIRAACSLRGLEMIPTVLTVNFASGIQEKFAVPFSSEDRTVDDVRGESECLDGGAHAVACSAMQRGIANDTAFADIFAARFELGLDQDHHFTALGEQRDDCRNQQRGGN